MIKTSMRQITATNKKRKIDAMSKKNKRIVDTQKKRQNGITSQMSMIKIHMKETLI